jgi:major membrane immunogen (membrane-anchored lipoprotein)
LFFAIYIKVFNKVGNKMKTRKIGLMMGAGLLLTGTGVATAITTTSCSNDKKSGLSFVNGTMEAISQSIDDADQKNGYRLAATITGFDDTK